MDAKSTGTWMWQTWSVGDESLAFFFDPTSDPFIKSTIVSLLLTLLLMAFNL